MTLKADAQTAPLYRQVAGALREEIVSGVFPVGALLPTEDRLGERFGVSRHTVREALRLLRDDGFVSSRRGSGTVVIPPRVTGTDIHQVMSINDLLAFAAGTEFRIETIDTVTLDAKLARATGLTENEQWLQVCGYRFAEDAQPVCRTVYYINRAFGAIGRMLPRHTGPIFPLIEDRFGQKVVEVRQQISATLLSADLAQVLQEREGAPALEVRRSYLADEGLVAQVTINTHPASRFQHSMTMRRLDA